MSYRALLQFYKSLFPFIAAFSILGVAFLGIMWGFVFFATLGLVFGFFGFRYFYGNQFYFYYNLGLTHWNLFASSFIINLFVGIPIFGVLLLFITFIFGNFQIT